MKKILVVFGTRPEAIKLAPVIIALREQALFECIICVTGQHREMLDQVLDVFGIIPDIDLELMVPGQTLAGLTSKTIAALDSHFKRIKPDLVLVQGDTTTVFCAALVAFYNHISLGHIEAGLRTWNKLSPFPEEINRVLTSRLADIHFAPTDKAKENLSEEGVNPEDIIVTGNTVIDALLIAREKVLLDPPFIEGLPEEIQPATISHSEKPRIVLITGHRRENFGQGFEDICQAISELSFQFPSVHFIYPVHLNPKVQEPVYRILGERGKVGEAIKGISIAKQNYLVNNVHLIKPLEYLSFVALMNLSTVILTDSGGVQEEAPTLGIPVLVMRDTTERPEAVQVGAVKLVGTKREGIVLAVSLLLSDHVAYSEMVTSINPYGDGTAATKISQACLAMYEK